MTKRRFERIDRQLLVNYDHFNLDNLQDDAGIARTLDMSVRGLLMEVPRALEPGSSLRLSLNIGDDLVEAFGDIARCDAGADGMFEIGIELKYVPEKFIQAVEDHFSASGGDH